MMQGNWKRRMGVLAAAFGLLGGGTAFAAQGKAKKQSELDVVMVLERMVAHGRAIVNNSQDLINDKEKGDKGFTADSFAGELAKIMKDEDHLDITKLAGKTDAVSKNVSWMLESMRKVVTDAQPVINQKGMGFKGFIPAAFARKCFEEFNVKSAIKGKVTAKQFRNAKNAPDEWETEQLDKFLKPDYPHGKAISQVVTLASGDKALRYIKPEYYTGKCLNCHGEPKDAVDITGSKKEGFKDGAPGAALSFIAPMK